MKGTHCLLLAVLFSATVAYPQQSADFYRLSYEGVELAYNMDFDAAIQRFDNVIASDPENPHGYLLKAVCNYYLYLVDMDDEVREKRFQKAVSRAIEVGKKKLRNAPGDIDALFYLGTSYIYLAAFHGETNSWLRAYWYGKEGLNYLKSVIERDPEYYDAYLGLGLYHYYADVMPKLVKAVSYLLGVEADRPKGLAELNLVREKGAFARTEATFFLSYIFLYVEKEHAKALPLLQELTAAYPQNPVFHIVLGDAYRKFGRHTQAVETYKKAASDRNYSLYPGLVNTSHYLLGNIYFEMNEFERAIQSYARAVESAKQVTRNKESVYAWGLYKQGECFDILGDTETAQRFYAAIRKEHNKNAFEKAQLRLKNGLRRVDAEILQAKNYIITRNFDTAIQTYERLLQRLSANNIEYPRSRAPEIYYYLGRVRSEQRAWNEAINDFKKVLAERNMRGKWLRPWTHFRLGNCYRYLGQIDLALAQYKQAYKYDDGELRFAIDKINQELKGSN